MDSSVSDLPPQNPALKEPRILAIANQKGGVGKTTTAINLATALAAAGQKVLLVDFDPQGNASTGLGIDRADRSASSYDLLLGETPLDQVIAETGIPNLLLVPAGADLELAALPRRNHKLRDVLRGAPALSLFRYVLIDCPPSLGLLTLNALVAADAVLVPLQCEFFALEGLSQLLRTIGVVRDRLNPTLDIEGIVLTMFDRRNRLSDQVADDVRKFLGNKVFDTVIPRNVRISEAPSHGKPALLYDHRCLGSQAYIQLAREMLKRERAARAA
jgi:chromosome partitioning protein